jgi:hypothetical protein
LTDKFYDNFKVPEDYVIPIEEVYERYGREMALKLACNSGNEQCLTDTYIQNHLFADHDRAVPKGLENVIFCSGFRGTNKQAEWTSMWQIMQSTPDATFKSQALNALGCSDDPEILKDYLESTIGGSVIYTQAERRAILAAVLNSHSGLEAVINFMNDFELDIIRMFGYESLEEMLSVPAQKVTTEDQRNMFLDYLLTLDHLDADALKTISDLVNEKLNKQQELPNQTIIGIIKKLLEGLNEETTTETDSSTVSSTITDSTTEIMTSEQTTVSMTMSSSTTQLPSTTQSPSMSPSTSSQQTTTIVSPTSTSIQSSTTPLSTSTTTLGASTAGIKIFTLFIGFFIVMFLTV